MLASFVIRFHSRRLGNLCQVLRTLGDWHADVVARSECVLVCHDRIGELRTPFPSRKLICLNAREWPSGRMINVGVRAAESDRIVLLDSDRVSERGYYARALADVRPGKLLTPAKIRNLLRPSTDEELSSGETEFEWDPRTRSNRTGWRCALSGNAVFLGSDFEKTGGADESYVGYGFEDHDLTARFEAAGVEFEFRNAVEYHLPHARTTYGGGEQDRLFIANAARYARRWGAELPADVRSRIRILAGELI